MEKKKKIALKMRIPEKFRIPTDVLLKFCKMGGKIGRTAARYDSWQSRYFDRDKGIYKELKDNEKKNPI